MEQAKKLDYSTVIGIMLTLVIIAMGIYLGKGKVLSFVDFPSFLIVICGTFLVVTACFSFKDIYNLFPTIFHMIFFHVDEPRIAAQLALDVAKVARTEGLREFEGKVQFMSDDPIFIKGAMLVADQALPETIERILTQDIAYNYEKHGKVVNILRKSGEVSPAMGLIGTLIGLVQMLSSLSDVSKIGPAMAIALLTTFYGALLSYVVFYPLASKVERNAREELINAKIYLKAFTSIARKENPRHLEILINSMLEPNRDNNRFF